MRGKRYPEIIVLASKTVCKWILHNKWEQGVKLINLKKEAGFPGSGIKKLTGISVF
jgi:hypothetical protein